HEGLGVRELVVTRRAVRPISAAPQRRRHLPARGQGESDLGRPLQLPFLVEKEIGAEELAEVSRDARRREIDRVGEKVELRGYAIALVCHVPPRGFAHPTPG